MSGLPALGHADPPDQPNQPVPQVDPFQPTEEELRDLGRAEAITASVRTQMFTRSSRAAIMQDVDLRIDGRLNQFQKTMTKIQHDLQALTAAQKKREKSEERRYASTKKWRKTTKDSIDNVARAMHE